MPAKTPTATGGRKERRVGLPRVAITFKTDGETREEVHYDGTGNDYTLCGHDTAGDDLGHGEEWSEARPSGSPVTCEQCLAIVAYVLDHA